MGTAMRSPVEGAENGEVAVVGRRVFVAGIGVGALLLGASGVAKGQEQTPEGTLSAQQAAAVAEDASSAIVTAPETELISMQQIAPRLEMDGDGTFVLRGSLADASIPAASGGAFSVEGSTLQVNPVDAGSAQGEAVGEATVVFPNTATDTDTFLRGSGAGIESITQIRGPQSPEQISWQVDLAPNQQLLETSDGGVSVVADDDAEPADDGATSETESDDAVDEFEDTATSPDEQIDAAQQTFEAADDQAPKSVVALITAPLAFDATGAAVPATLSADGDVVTMTVEHHSPGVEYPVEADPYWSGTNVYPGFDRSFPVARTKAAIDDLDSRGFNHVVIVPQLFTETLVSNNVQWIDGRKTCGEVAPGDNDSVAKSYNDGLQTVINYADNVGLNVVLKPHLNVVNFDSEGNAHPEDGKSRTDIIAADRATWWDNYGCKIRKYANYTHAGQVVLGTELTKMTDDNADSTEAKSLITAIHGDVPNHQLGYATNWDATIPENVGNLSTYFFKNLDFIGVDAYYRGIWPSYLGNNGFGPQDAVADGKTVNQIITQWGTVARPTGTQCAPVSSTTPRPDSYENIANPGVAFECLNDTYSSAGTNDMEVVVSEVGYDVGSSTNGFVAAYSFWNNWANQFADRCGWFKGIWPWAYSSSDGTDTFALDDSDLDQIQARRNGQC